MHALSSSELTIFLFTVGLMLILARLLSKVGYWLNVPTLIIELLIGIVLGPSLLGRFFPETYSLFFPEGGNLLKAYDTLFSLSVVMLLFIAGMELDFTLLAKHTRAILFTSVFIILIPFILGVLFAWQNFSFLKGIEISASPFVFPLTFGVLIIATALALVVRLLMEYHFLNSPLGATIMGTAIIIDLVGWFSFSSILVYANAAVKNIQILYTFFYIFAFFVAVFFISGQKKLMKKVFSDVSRSGSSYDLAMLFGICLLTSAFTNSIHIHSSLGAFIAGIVCRRIIGGNSKLLEQLKIFIMNFFVPIFFISIGLSLNFVDNFNLKMVTVVIVFASITKILSAFVGAYLGGKTFKEAWAIGFCLNTRGVMDVVMCTLAMKLGLIGPQLFVAFIIFSIFTCFLTEYTVPLILNLKKSNQSP
jgi:Kef-type K+ transport system membrane component KefB